jgi:class 3 adenylate cyclase/tetratricopeptide (TPR) repeat protein
VLILRGPLRRTAAFARSCSRDGTGVVNEMLIAWPTGEPMRCSQCGSENPDAKKFCGDCGAPLANRCPNCSSENPAGKRFCGECGSALIRNAHTEAAQSSRAESSAPYIRIAHDQTDASLVIEGERKTVTALFADIKGSMELMADLDPEEARAIIDPALKHMIEAVRRYDGYIVQSTGDGIFALFGAPVAHEDHPQRALHAAVRLQEAIRGYSAKLVADGGTPLEARVGINTGEVVVRTLTTADGHTEYTPIGHTANLASRMQAIAPTGSIAITEHTRPLVEGYFQLKSRGPSRVKGLSEPINVYEVTGIGPLRTRLQRASVRGLTKFVGREREMDMLRHALEHAKTGHGQIVAAIAEPGVGKSRLFYEFKATSQSGCMVLEAYSVSHGKASAYLPVIELLKNYFEITSEDEERKRREKITGKLLTLDRGLEDTLPYLFVLLDVHGDDDSITQLEPQLRRRRTLEATKRVLVRESLNQPLIVIFEDLHWIDAETQALLSLLVETIATVRILLLVNYRSEYQHPWSSKTYYLQLRLDPLRPENAEEMLTALLGDDEGFVTLRRLIIDKTEGNPFFMEEIVQALFEQGVLARNGALKLTKGLKEIRVPSTVQAVLTSRIDRLSSAEKELLQTLAVIGRDFSLRLVRCLVATSDEELERMLTGLQLAEFIYEQPARGGVEYTFKHALTQEVAYNSVLIERRKALHERTGEALERMFADRLDDCVTDLAHHYDRSSNLRKAVEYLERAGRRAMEQAAHSEAMGYVTRALELIKKLPDGADRARHELELQMTLSFSLHVTVGPGSPEREKPLARALELCEQLGDSRMMEVMLSLGSVRWARSEPLLALQLFEKALALAEQAKDADLLAAAHAGIGIQLAMLGQFEKAREHLEGAIELSGSRPIRKFGQVLLMAQLAPFLLAHVLLVLGYPMTALKRSKDALDTARRRSGPYMNSALGMYVMTYLGLGDIPAVAEQVEELAAITAEHEIPIIHALATFYRAWLIANAGRVKEGLGEMRRSITRLLGAIALVEWLVVALAEVCGRNGLLDEGLATVKAALTRSEKIPYLQAEFYRLKGELTLLKDPRSEAEAERCLRQAIDIARRQAARLFELRATTSIARLLAKQGRREEAHRMLTGIYNWFTEGFDTADLKDAKALLDELLDG